MKRTSDIEAAPFLADYGCPESSHRFDVKGLSLALSIGRPRNPKSSHHYHPKGQETLADGGVYV